ncbi:MAG: zf-TFIIB domain-containing protein [Myxococcales bacterium]|nr:zf-TFIIB domain-containing protein [Myxococcales bacterium]
MLPSTAQNLVCPRCGLALSAAHSGAAALHGCRSCGGVWLDGATAARLTQALDGATYTLLEAGAGQATAPVDPARAIVCPECRAPLTRWTVQSAGVEVDTCGNHGTWFDRHELQRIAQSTAIAQAYGRGAPAATAGAANPVATASASDDSGDDSSWDALELGLGVVFGVIGVLSD